MSQPRISPYRVWILASDRGTHANHLDEIYHWNIVVEDAKSGMWKECHASEIEPCLRGMHEQFEDVPASYARRPLQAGDSDRCVEVARFDPRRLTAIMDMLEATSISHAAPGATCRLYVKRVLETLIYNRKQYGIICYRTFQDAYDELQEKLGPLERSSGVNGKPDSMIRMILMPAKAERMLMATNQSPGGTSSSSGMDVRRYTFDTGRSQHRPSDFRDAIRKRSIAGIGLFMKRKST